MDDYYLSRFRHFSLNKQTVTKFVKEYIVQCQTNFEEHAKHSFHKIMIPKWPEDDFQLFDALRGYYESNFIPVNYVKRNVFVYFYTSSLNFVFKIVHLNFTFPHHGSTHDIEIIFNDKTSVDLFGELITIDDIVSKVVTRRFSESFDLDLSNFSKDTELTYYGINFYKLSLLSTFKTLMLSLAKEIKGLNLSNNHLSVVPVQVLDFFIKSDLKEINLSNNNIKSFSKLHRMSSKIEKLWLEGNPLCERYDAVTYVKEASIKFPRLIEMDGLKINPKGLILPFHKNYMESSMQPSTQTLVNNFLMFYFVKFDSKPRNEISMFYDMNAQLALSTPFTKAEEQTMEQDYLVYYSRNILHPNKRDYVNTNQRLYRSRNTISELLKTFPATVHDPKSFTVDVLLHDRHHLLLVVDGIYKEEQTQRIWCFRRTFLFAITVMNDNFLHQIVNEMFTISVPSPDQLAHSFTSPIRNYSTTFLNPDTDDQNAICNTFQQLTQLKKEKACMRLKATDWNIRLALSNFVDDMQNNKVTLDELVKNQDGIFNSSSLFDDVIEID